MARGISRHVVAFLLLFQSPSATTLEASTSKAPKLPETKSRRNRPLPGILLHHGCIPAIFKLIQLFLATGDPFGILATESPDLKAAEHG